MGSKCQKSVLTAVILAAGESSRMKYPKPLLEIAGKTFTSIIVEKIHKAGISDIIFVLGANAEFIKENINTDKLTVILNRLWQEGQLSSLQAAIKEVRDRTEGIMVFLIDHPQIKILTIQKMIESYKNTAADVIVPEYNGRTGHPVIFRHNVFEDLMKTSLSKGAREVIRDSKYNVIKIKVKDPYIRQDIDTQEEFKNIEIT